jgi:prolipoprotein diacylglyceryl transferase
VFGVILGGRLGYVLFYKPLYYLAHPFEIFEVWHGGMSFHGGFLGVLIALVFFARHRHKALLDVTDFVAPLCPLGLAAGRLGNFINAELVVPAGGSANKPGKLPVERHLELLREAGFSDVRAELAFGEYVAIVATKPSSQ